MRQPEGGVAIMIVGDSISHGSCGDWTWRYRLWKHLRNHDVRIDPVGPQNHLDNIRTQESGDGDLTYADPEFDTDHCAQWGRPYVLEKEVIEAKVATHRPEYLLVLLGINDLFWHDIDPVQFEANLREFVLNARRAAPSVRIVLGAILPTKRAMDDQPFGVRVAACNLRLRALACELSTPESPVVVANTDAEFVAQEHTWDGTHPNTRGEFRIAAAFADALAWWFSLGAAFPRPYPDVENVSAEVKSAIPPS